MNNYERKLYDKYAYSKPYIYLIYEEFERRVNSTLEEYEGLKTGECWFDYESWERRLSLTRYKMQSSIKILTNEKYIKKILQGKKNVGASIFYLCRFDNNQNHNYKDSNSNSLGSNGNNQSNNNNQNHNKNNNQNHNCKGSNINGLDSNDNNQNHNKNNNQNHNISIYNNPNIISNNNIYSQKKEMPKEYLEIFDYWNSLKIIKHIEFTAEREKAIKKALKKYDVETIKIGIRNYNKILKDESYYFNYKWSLENFLNRSKGISEFLEDGERYINYVNDKERDKLRYEYNTRTNKKFEDEEFYLKDGTKVTAEEFDRACIEESKRYYEKYCKDIDINDIDF